MLPQLLLGFAIALLIAAAAYLARALSKSGALAAVVLGTVVFGIGGLPMAVLLVAFFVTSSLLSRLFGRRKRSLDEKFSKGSRRDAGQVLANGGIAGLFVLLSLLFPDQNWPWVAAAAALAAANADTWATELGVLNPTRPVLITSGKPVERGASGGVSWGGTLAAAGGAALIALLAAPTPALWASYPGLIDYLDPGCFLPVAGPINLSLFAVLTAAGLAGSLVDSLLGATLQAIYTCPQCGKETERHPLHSCGAPTLPLRGLSWLTNDLVNAACTLSAALIAILLAAFRGVC